MKGTVGTQERVDTSLLLFLLWGGEGGLFRKPENLGKSE